MNTALSRNRVVVARTLTTDAVSLARAAGADLTVTGPGSLYSHGANALRYYAVNGVHIAWRVTDSLQVLPSQPRLAIGRLEQVNADEFLAWEHTAQGSLQRIPVRAPSSGHRGKAGHLAFLLGSRQARVVVMGNRSYDILTASLMMPGLADCATWLSGERVRVARAASGHLVLGTDRLTHDALVAMASDPDLSGPYLRRQTSVYRVLHRRWQSCRDRPATNRSDLLTAASMLTSFFGVLILLHRSYSEVLAQGFADREKAQIAAVPRILRWQIDEVGLLPARKDALEAGHELPDPDFTVHDDIRETTKHVLAAAASAPRDQLTHLALVSVLKEWKFFLAKALHRHFSVTLRSLSGLDEEVAVPSSHPLRSLSITDLLPTFEDSPHVD